MDLKSFSFALWGLRVEWWQSAAAGVRPLVQRAGVGAPKPGVRRLLGYLIAPLSAIYKIA